VQQLLNSRLADAPRDADKYLWFLEAHLLGQR
jgi:hypothetical protein